MVLEPTSPALWGRGAGCLSGFSFYFISRLEGQNWILFYFYFRTDQDTVVSDAGCLSNVRNYLPGTVMQGCRLFKRCQNLPAGHCVTVVKAALAMSEPTCRALCCRGADC